MDQAARGATLTASRGELFLPRARFPYFKLYEFLVAFGVIVVAFVDVVVQVFAVVTCKHVPEYIEVVQV